MTGPPTARPPETAVPVSPCPRLLTIAEAAAVLNVPENWLRKKVAAHAVPYTRLGKHVRFTPAHLDQIIESGEQRPIAVVAPGQGLSSRARRAS
jgi:excisionase family DNA binding protein